VMTDGWNDVSVCVCDERDSLYVQAPEQIYELEAQLPVPAVRRAVPSPSLAPAPLEDASTHSYHGRHRSL
jgi:hypothetical protein